MKKIIKKMFVTLFAMAFIFNSSSIAFAYDNNMFNVSTVAPIDEDSQTTYGLDKPSSSAYVDLNNESLDFKGKASLSYLYTNKCFTGKKNVGYVVTNNIDKKLTIKVYKIGGISAVKTLTIDGNSFSVGTIYGLDPSEKYYLRFSAPSDFSGSIVAA